MVWGQFVKKTSMNLSVNQFRTKANFKRLKITSNLEQVKFQNDISKRRVLNGQTLNYQTTPYGFKG